MDIKLKTKKVRILIQRIARKDGYTIGHLYVNGLYVCDTLENTERGLCRKMAPEIIREQKAKGDTAIPQGVYKVTIDVESPVYSASAFMDEFANGGRVPLIEDVPEFEGILILPGSTVDDTYGGIIVGYNTAPGQLTKSYGTFIRLYALLHDAKGEITITVV